jgi:hypothetical protein
MAVLSVAPSVSAQRLPGDSLTPLQTAVACQSPPVLAGESAGVARIVGSQDVVERSAFGSPEVLVLDGGTNRDIKVNDVYFVRRLFRTAETLHDKLAHTVVTAGWVRVVASNEKTALVSPEHLCSDIRAGDFLEPFVAPSAIASEATEPLVQTELNFDAYARVLHGDFERRSISANEFATIEHGVDVNIRVGTRFGIYRDLQLAGNPLKRIGEAVAVSVGPSLTLVRVTNARDAIYAGDFMVPRTADGVAARPAVSDTAAARHKSEAPSPLSGCQSGGRVPPQNPRCGG